MSEPSSERTRVRREPGRGVYERGRLLDILDAGLVAHVGFVDDGTPFVLPMAYGRDGDTLYLHGSVASRLQRRLAAGTAVCVTVTLLDGLVLARSAFATSMNYRCVVVLGRSREVTDPRERLRALERVMAHAVPGHWDHVRAPNDRELRATTVVAVPLDELSGKTRTGGPEDEPGDETLPVWGGEVPFETIAGPPIPDEHVPAGTRPPRTVTDVAPGRSGGGR